MGAFKSSKYLQLNPYSIQLIQYGTIQSVAGAMGYNAQYLRRLLRAGKLSGTKIGQIWLINLASLAAYTWQAEEAVDRRCGPKVRRIAAVYTNVYDPGLQMYTFHDRFSTKRE